MYIKTRTKYYGSVQHFLLRYKTNMLILAWQTEQPVCLTKYTDFSHIRTLNRLKIYTEFNLATTDEAQTGQIHSIVYWQTSIFAFKLFKLSLIVL